MPSLEIRPFRRGDCDQLTVMDGWGARRQWADGSLPALATYGVPACWPHVRGVYERAGFAFEGRVEIVYCAAVADLPSPGTPPLRGLGVRREVGEVGTRMSAMLEEKVVGFIEVETDMTEGGTRSRFAGWGDIGNLHVEEELRRQGIGTWLLVHGAEWLRLGRVDRVLDYAWPKQADLRAFLGHGGFRELVRSERGWVRQGRA